MIKMKVVIYTGLSVPFKEAKSILNSTDETEVIYKRPIKRGDILEDIKENVDIIGIIDGIFHQAPSVAHKEIIKAIDSGIAVFGASSMGALRASELDSLGMTGIGYVYKQYRDGKITSDDDVAVVLDNETLKPLSTPLVSMEYTFTEAVAENIITSEQKEDLLKIAKDIYYPQRTYSNIFKNYNLDETIQKNLINFINNAPDIKKEDSKELLKYIKDLIK